MDTAGFFLGELSPPSSRGSVSETPFQRFDAFWNVFVGICLGSFGTWMDLNGFGMCKVPALFHLID